MKTQRQQTIAASASAVKDFPETLWIGPLAVIISTGFAFLLYWFTAAPGLTWAHQGADGGDFLAAAVSGGVPHPSGYPLYTLLLQAWLRAWGGLTPEVSPAKLGNLLSVTLGALSVGVTVLIAAHFAERGRTRWLAAGATALLWAVSPLFWSQSLITEVYTLHLLLAALLVWAILLQPSRPALLGVIIGLGAANHLTFVLLLPAAAYLLWRRERRAVVGWRGAVTLVVAGAVAAVLYLRIPFAAAGNGAPPPVNWGYADNWAGFWWLVSGKAYRAYFVDQAWAEVGARIAAWARTLTIQYTPLGLIVAAVGLTQWDRVRPELRTFSLLWALPVSLYAIIYATRDSQIYLLPAVWIMALWIAAGLGSAAAWLSMRFAVDVERVVAVLGGAVLIAACGLAVMRGPQISLHTDDAATSYLATVAAAIEPASIVISSSDAETFALWYGAWGSGELLERAPDTVFVNDSLYQFDWYRRLLGDLYPHVAGIDEGVAELVSQNAGVRPIYLAEHLDTIPDGRQETVGGIWRLDP